MLIKRNIVIACIFSFLFTSLATGALDPPHNGNNPGEAVGCNSCHITNLGGGQTDLDPAIWDFTQNPRGNMSSPLNVYNNTGATVTVCNTIIPPLATVAVTCKDTDDSGPNRICYSCHTGAKGMTAHSLLRMFESIEYTKLVDYGLFSVECRECHHPHFQRQLRVYGSQQTQVDDTPYVVKGTVSSIGAPAGGYTPVTFESALTGDYNGQVLIPNLRYYWYAYKIDEPGGTQGKSTIQVRGAINTTYAPVGGGYEFGILLSNLVRDKVSDTGGTPKAVKYFRKSGAYSGAWYNYLNGTAVADPTTEADEVVDGICQVCHTKTPDLRQDGSPLSYHTDVNSAKCDACHDHPTEAFAPTGCSGCHGASGRIGEPLVPEELVGVQNTDYQPTGHGVGAHPKHVTDAGYTDCEICHYQNAMPTVDGIITIAFSGRATAHNATPAYDGTPLQNGYTYNGGVTTNTANQECSNLYCHSDGTSVATGVVPIGSTPGWDSGASQACNSCHGYPPSYPNGSPKANSHNIHIQRCESCHSSGMSCYGCHYSTTSTSTTITNPPNHANGRYDIKTSSHHGMAYTFDPAGGSCATYCHETVPWGAPFVMESLSLGTPYIVGSDIRVSISWLTPNVQTTSYVDYGLTSSYGTVQGNDVLVTSHTVILPNLQNHATYHYRARSADASGNEVVSSDHTFTPSIPPSVPELIFEPDAVSFSSTASVTLEWNPSTDIDGGPVEYYVEVYSDYREIEYFSGWISGTIWTCELETGKDWHWRVRARDGNDANAVSGGSVIDSFVLMGSNPPPAPILIAEPDVSSYGCTYVTEPFEWIPVTDPDGDPVEYQVYVDVDSISGNFPHESAWITGTSYLVSSLPPGSTVSWKVRARDANNPEAVSESDTDSFYLSKINPPIQPTLVDEPDVVSQTPAPVTLQWNPSPSAGVIEYRVQVDDDENLGSPDHTSGWLSTTEWAVTLDSGIRWYWRVHAQYADYPADYFCTSSSTDSFSIASSQPPPFPSLVDEPNAITCEASAPVTLEWNPVTDPEGDPVEYQVQTHNSFIPMSDGPVSEWISGTSWTNTFNKSNTYWWRVRARDASHPDAVSGWSGTDSFYVSEPPLSQVSIIPEPDFASPVPAEITLEWDPMPDQGHGPFEYSVEVSASGGFITSYASGWISGTSWTITLDPGKTWYWRVVWRLVNYPCRQGNWSYDSFVFYTSNPPPAPTLMPEPDYASCPGQTATVTLEWNPAIDPDGDPVEYYVTFVAGSDSGWISETSWTFTFSCREKSSYQWYVEARDANHLDAVSPRSPIDCFIYASLYGC